MASTRVRPIRPDAPATAMRRPFNAGPVTAPRAAGSCAPGRRGGASTDGSGRAGTGSALRCSSVSASTRGFDDGLAVVMDATNSLSDGSSGASIAESTSPLNRATRLRRCGWAPWRRIVKM